jgi:hypothetical protein
MLTQGGDTEGERANAERALSVLLRTHALERADVAALAKPVADAELLEQGAEVRCFGHGLKVTPWTCSLARACKALFGTAYYLLGGQEYVFYGETGASMSTAQLFAELYPTILQLADEYMEGAYARRRAAGGAPNPLSARASYRHGLCEGFANLAQDVAAQRKEYVKRVVAETEYQRKAVADRSAELAEKQRIQRLAALQAVNETLAAVAAAEQPAAEGASGSGAGASAEAATGAGATAGAGAAAEEAANACAICWEPMTKGVAFITNPCGHAFHVSCQATAVAARLTSCGLCRAPLTLTVFPAAAPAAAAAALEDDSDDADVSSDDSGGGAGDAGGSDGMSDEDDDDVVVCTGEYTAEEAAAARRAEAEVVDLTAEDLQALAQEVHKKHSDALTLALVAEREAAVVKALHEKIFSASCRRKDGSLKASCYRKSKRVARDADAYGAGKQDAKRLKMGNTLEG